MAQSRRDDPGALGFSVLTVLEAAEGNLKAMETLAGLPESFPVRLDGILRNIDGAMFSLL
jgi:hypothetical protein